MACGEPKFCTNCIEGVRKLLNNNTWGQGSILPMKIGNTWGLEEVRTKIVQRIKITENMGREMDKDFLEGLKVALLIVCQVEEEIKRA